LAFDNEQQNLLPAEMCTRRYLNVFQTINVSDDIVFSLESFTHREGNRTELPTVRW